MINYYSKIIPDFATKAKPLRKLRHRGKSWNWTAPIAPVTAYFDPVRHTEISVDAIPAGLTEILSQIDEKTKEKQIVAYASHLLSETELRHSQTKRKVLAFVWACEYLHLYIYGKIITV